MKPWFSLLGAPAPRHFEPVAELTVDRALQHASQGVGMLWQGTFPDARLLLDAMRRRIDRRLVDPAESFYRYRQQKKTRARLLGMLAVPLDRTGRVALRLAPDVRAAVIAANGTPVTERTLALRELLGMLSAHQWRTGGILVPALGARIHPHYGVFAPTRHEYVDLVAAAPLRDPVLALDIGTGTGVLAAVLANRGVRRIIATDVSARAVACARENLAGLPVEVRQIDLFPPERADLVVCNPPWLPAAPGSLLDHGVYDDRGRMLAGFLTGLDEHLTPGGEAWLVLSDVAEQFGLHTRADLLTRFQQAGLTVVNKCDIAPRHGSSRGEVVSLWRLSR